MLSYDLDLTGSSICHQQWQGTSVRELYSLVRIPGPNIENIVANVVCSLLLFIAPRFCLESLNFQYQDIILDTDYHAIW